MSFARLGVVAMLVALLGAPAISKSHSSASLKQAIQSVYNKMNSAASHKDVDGFLAFYDSDYIGYNPDGNQINFDTQREQTEAFFTQATKVHATTTVQSVKQQGNGIVAIARTHLTLVVDDPSTGKPATINQDSTDRDNWVKDSGSWKLRQEKTLSIQVFQNGKRVK